MQQYVIGVVVGFVFSLFVGWPVVGSLNSWLRKQLLPVQETNVGKSIPPFVTGLLERTVFTAVSIAYPANAPAAMMGWLALKMASGWNKGTVVDRSNEGKEMWSRHSFAALLAGLGSMFFAWTGGMLARWIIGLSTVAN